MLNMSINGYQEIRHCAGPLERTYPHFEQNKYNTFVEALPAPFRDAAMHELDKLIG